MSSFANNSQLLFEHKLTLALEGRSTKGITVSNIDNFNNLPVDIEVSMNYTANPRVPASMYGGADRVGWPEEGGDVEVYNETVVAAHFHDGHQGSPDEIAKLQQLLLASLSQYRQQFIEDCLEDANAKNEPSDDDRDYGYDRQFGNHPKLPRRSF